MRKLRLALIALLGVLALMLGGPGDCGGPLDRRGAICREAVAAVAPPGAAVEILHVGRAPAPASVRVDYRLAEAGQADRARWVVCGFSADSDLLTVTTQSGALSGATVHLLKRYFREAVETETGPAR